MRKRTDDKSPIYPSVEEVESAKLGFSAIRERLLHHCANEVSRYLVSRMHFMDSSSRELRTELRRVTEMQELCDSRTLPSWGFGALRSAIKGVRPEGSYLEPEQLRALREMLDAAADTAMLLTEDEAEDYPLLHRLIGRLEPLEELRQELHRLVGDDGEIPDGASDELRSIRRAIRSLESSLGATMQRVLRHARQQGWVDADASAVMRDGRLLLPINPGNKRDIRGIVYEESATGKTLFVEPEEVVLLHNEIREKEGEERQEILRLLHAFADRLRPWLDTVRDDITILGILDFVHAKVLLAGEMDAVVPVIETGEQRMEWWKARHPLLERHLREEGRSLVPLDIKLSPEDRILIVSGPNAGGKSITLKTVGLLQYMLQCGLAVPMQDHSVMMLFDKIFIDIGDQQSLEDDLSTYSSHLTNIKFFTRNATDRTLLLIDEFGSGTEPTIGGAIAEGALEQFRRMGAYGVVTTHYGNLKDYASTHDGLINGAMLFDRQRIQPLYQLVIGQPGSSFAIEIARSIGLPEVILDYASEQVGEDFMLQDKYLQDIMRDKAYWGRKRSEVHKRERELEEERIRLQQKLDALQSKRESVLSKAHQEALDIVSSANAAVEKTIRDIKTAKADKERTKKARQKLDNKRTSLEQRVQPKEKREQKKSNVSREAITIGTGVTLEGGNTVGEVTEIKGKEARVSLGSITVTVPLSKLTPTIRKQTIIHKEPPKVVEMQSDERRLAFKPLLDCRGQRVDEALRAVTGFLDEAVSYGMSTVRILHGTGTGALRQSIRELLSDHPHVASYEDERADLGGAGITVVHIG